VALFRQGLSAERLPLPPQPGNREITVSITSLSDAELISILQYEDLDDGITQFVEAEIARRKKEGTPNN
jgi:hypothetical protein